MPVKEGVQQGDTTTSTLFMTHQEERKKKGGLTGETTSDVLVYLNKLRFANDIVLLCKYEEN